MEKEDGRSLGRGRPVTALFQSDAQRYVTDLKYQFRGKDIVGLATQVDLLLADPRYRSAVERDVIGLRARAAASGFVRKNSNALAIPARIHMGSWYPFAQGGVPAYERYVRRGLDDIVKGYRPKETK